MSGHKHKNFKKIHQLHRYFKKAAKEMAGYPVAQFFDYSKLFHFLNFHINNVGDPFHSQSSLKINTHKIEKEVIDAFAEIFHAPKGNYWGYVTNGGTEGNLYGLYVARQLYPEGVVLYSDQTHYSIPKCLNLLRMPSIKIKADRKGEIDYQDLQSKLLGLKKGEVPIIVANIGTTMKGAVDCVGEIKEVLTDLDMKKHYIHCDAAFFGLILPFLPELKTQKFDFRMDIDSIAISGHKMIGTPIPCGVVLVKKNNMQKIGSHIEYVRAKDNTITGSRNGLTPLFLWYELCCAEEGKFQKIISESVKKASYAVKKLNQHGIKAWRNKNSIIVVFPKPSEKTSRKWQLAVENDIAHMITMPHLSYDAIDLIATQVARDLGKMKKK